MSGVSIMESVRNDEEHKSFHSKVNIADLPVQEIP